MYNRLLRCLLCIAFWPNLLCMQQSDRWKWCVLVYIIHRKVHRVGIARSGNGSLEWSEWTLLFSKELNSPVCSGECDAEELVWAAPALHYLRPAARPEVRDSTRSCKLIMLRHLVIDALCLLVSLRTIWSHSYLLHSSKLCNVDARPVCKMCYERLPSDVQKRLRRLADEATAPTPVRSIQLQNAPAPNKWITRPTATATSTGLSSQVELHHCDRE